MPPKAILQKRVFQVSQHLEPEVKALIVDRDLMTSGLLADSLIRELKWSAVALRSSDLTRVLGTSRINLVVISADLNSSAGAGLDLAHGVYRAHPETAIVVLLDQPSREGVVNAFRSGARGVFHRQQSMNQFLDCVAQVSKGHIWAGREETGFLLEAFRSLPAPGVPVDSILHTLTRREMQAVRCAARGMTNKAIAGELKLSEHTVKNYLFRAFEKLGVSNRVELLFFLTFRGQSLGAADATGAAGQEAVTLERGDPVADG